LPVGYRQECTLHIANQRLGPEANTTSAVVFRIAADWLAIPTKVLQEVAERRRLHSLPHRRKGFILGLANVRGELLLCVSLAHFLELENTASLETLQSTYHWLLAVKWERERFAFPVHEVHGPHRFQFQEEKNAPIKMASSKSTNAPKFVQWQQRTVGLVNPRLLFAALNRNLT
jgi:chemotaxis-related protein WspD